MKRYIPKAGEGKARAVTVSEQQFAITKTEKLYANYLLVAGMKRYIPKAGEGKARAVIKVESFKRKSSMQIICSLQE